MIEDMLKLTIDMTFPKIKKNKQKNKNNVQNTQGN